MNIVILMAGDGMRFRGSRFTDPKPFIDVFGKPMYAHALESLSLSGRVIAIAKSGYDIPEADIVIHINKTMPGPAASASLAREHIDNDEPLIILNSDQKISWDSELLEMPEEVDGAIWLFEATGNRWSYAKVDNGMVSGVAEKKEISQLALCGIHYWRRGSDFIKYLDAMVLESAMVNDEFYIAPIYQYAINDGLKIAPIMVNKMIDMGTPDSLEAVLRSHQMGLDLF